MPVFKYRAVTSDGHIVQNRVDASSRRGLIEKLKRNELTPINIVQVNSISLKREKKKKKNTNNVNDILNEVNPITFERNFKSRKVNITIGRKVKTRDLIIFTQDLYLLKKANFNNIHALSTIIETTENLYLREIIKDILSGVEAGEYMYTTMEYYSEVFPYLYVNMVKVGEQSGSLSKSLQDAVEYLDENEKFSKKIRSSLVPNLVTFGLILAVLFVGEILIIPIIQDLFISMGSTQELPAITMFFSNMINWIISFWYIPLVIIGIIVGAIIYYINTPKGKYNFDYFKYRVPLFGKLIFSLDFLRFAKAMLLNLDNGIRIQDSLETSKNVVKNLVLRSIIESSINDIILGQSWVDAFEKSNLASPMIIEMLNIGMSTDLREMLRKLIEYMKIDIDNTISKIMEILPIILYIGVGIALVFVVIVVLLPCIQAYMGGWLFEAAGV